MPRFLSAYISGSLKADVDPGPAGGYLLFSDCAANVIYKWMAVLAVYLEKSGYTGTDSRAA
jgi:hypothetical protein